MAAFSTLALGLLLGAAGGAAGSALLGRHKTKDAPAAPGLARRGPAATPTAAEQVAATGPPNARVAESGAIGGALTAAARTRRRATGSHAGRVPTGTGRPPQGLGATSAPRTLIGY